MLERFWCKGLFKVFSKSNILSMGVQELWEVGSETAGRWELYWTKSWFCKDASFIHLYKRLILVNQESEQSIRCSVWAQGLCGISALNKI